MNTQENFFIDAWKAMAEIDDVLAGQAAEAARRIAEKFELKQQRASTTTGNSFRLQVIVRKEFSPNDKDETSPYALLDLSLPATSYVPSKEEYLEAVKSLREATDEAMTAQPMLTRVGVRFRWARRFR